MKILKKEIERYKEYIKKSVLKVFFVYNHIYEK
jgi:hypothetical protein